MAASATSDEPQAPPSKPNRSLIFCLLFFVLATVLLAVVILLLFVYLPAAKCGPDVCATRECIEVGAFITQNLNLTADPCEDFFKFACGGYADRNRYSSQSIKTGIGAYVDMIKNLQSKIFELLYLDGIADTDDREMAELYNISRAMFHSCMAWHNAYWTGSGALASFVDPLFEFVSEGIRTNQLTSLEQLLGRLMKRGATGLVKLELNENEYLEILSAETDGSREFNYTRISIRTDLFGFAKRWTREDLQPVLDALTVNDSLDFAKILSLKGGVDQLVGMQNRLFDVIEAEAPVNDSSFLGTLDSLQRTTLKPGAAFNWSRLLYHAFDRQIGPDHGVSVQNAKILSRVLDSLAVTAKFAVSEYCTECAFVLLDAVLAFAKFFPEPLRGQVRILKHTGIPVQMVESTKDEMAYPKFCMLFAMTSMQPVVVDMFTRAYIKQGFSDIHRIIEDIKQAMEQNVDEEAWISKQGKLSIKFKIRSVKQSVGYDPMSSESIKAYFADVRRLYKRDRGFGHFVGLYQTIEARKQAQVMTANSTVSYFFVTNPLQVNAFNFMERNTIIFPMGILGPYLYDPKYPVYLRYGGIGTVIGHEIGHSFDDAGHILTDSGSEGHFWDNSTEAAYLNRTGCLVDSFSAMELGKGTRLDGNATLGNNIADVLGISSAYRALRNQLSLPGSTEPKRLPGALKKFTPEMMFFIQFAQIWCEKVPPEVYVTRYKQPTHSPPKLRILGSLRNSREFAEVFACKAGSGMNPVAKCRLW